MIPCWLGQSICVSFPSFIHPKGGECRLRTSLCLQYKPHHIAAGAVCLAAKFLKVKLPSDVEKGWWQEFDVTPRQLEGSCFILEYYSAGIIQLLWRILCFIFFFSYLYSRC